jgi:hypothetical protein
MYLVGDLSHRLLLLTGCFCAAKPQFATLGRADLFPALLQRTHINKQNYGFHRHLLKRDRRPHSQITDIFVFDENLRVVNS